jgi:5'(3')-deoxyribonucleotidase
MNLIKTAMIETRRRPTIAIDVDGVLRNNLGLMVDMYNELFNLGMTVDDVKEFKTEMSFPLIEKELHVSASTYFFQQRAKELFLDAPAYPRVTEDIACLKEVADVVIITYQKNYTNKKYTLEWLEKYGIEPNGICFLRDKTIVHCDALIDDNDWNFIGTHVNTSVLCTQPYNKNINLEELILKTNSKKIIRVDSLDDFTGKYLNGKITL